MKKSFSKYILLLVSIVLLCVSTSCNKSESNIPSEDIKVALREVGNQLLLSQNDTTSLVLPVIQKSQHLYELSFEVPLTFDPSALNTNISAAVKNADLPKNYLVEVLHCSTGEVAYSYKIARDIEKNIIPCAGRMLPEKCYTIQIQFKDLDVPGTKNSTLFYVLVTLVLSFLAFVFYSKYHAFHTKDDRGTATVLGSFSFYPEQNKLVKEAQEIPLTQKECELLAIFIKNPNQVIKREELTKKVWEDNGVIVGRSLDTYISKLRKKLQEDDTIKITNVHGVGYKLEI